MTEASPANPQPKPEWAPRMWQGCSFGAWARLLFKNRFAVNPKFLYIAVIVTFASLFNSTMRIVQELIYGWRARRTPLVGPPIFILGHWRTGTTLLHDLMIQDERFGYPTTYECLAPNHFLVTEGWLSRWLKFLMPTRRPMDNMRMSYDRPQEDEFALCMLGVPSPYLTIAFPNRPPQDPEYLDLEGLSPRALQRWKGALLWLLRRITFKTGKRLVLKSPPHTARIKVLRDMFPDAIFLHIVRDPYVVFPSTVRLWKSLYDTHGMQKPTYQGLEEKVFETYLRIHRRLEEGKKLLSPSQFHELRYEDLVRDPAVCLRQVYEHFNLGGWDQMAPRLDAYLATLKGYETNKYQLTPELHAQINARWGDVIRQYGYENVTSDK